MTQYRQLLESSSTGVNEVTNWIQSIFDKVISTVKAIVQWITDNAQTIVNIIKQIRDAFKLISAIFNQH
jgi:phage-related protein